MSQEIFKTLPQELIINILSRLPLRAIATCKCVCKPWVDLLATREFAVSHLPNSIPALVFNPFESTLRIFEFVDGFNLDHLHLHFNRLPEFRFPCGPLEIKCSANGLLLLALVRAQTTDPVVLFICNPITGDYIELQEFVYSSHREVVTYGFGASKITSQFKLVRIIHDRVHPKTSGFSKHECHVYTVGTGSWSRIQPGALLDYSLSSGGTGAFLNGNLHWMVYDSKGSLLISCFDLETESFSTFPAPLVPQPPITRRKMAKSLHALDNCLCLCDNSSCEEIVIWSMKEYGVEKSWIKEYVIPKNPIFIWGLLEPNCPNLGDISNVVHPLKVFKEGDMLMAWDDIFLFYYSDKTKTTRKINMFKQPSIGIRIKTVLHTPSFLSLKLFPMENVSSF